LEIQLSRRFGIPLTRLTPPQFGVCPNPWHWFTIRESYHITNITVIVLLVISTLFSCVHFI
jgi:hypothetical protein